MHNRGQFVVSGTRIAEMAVEPEKVVTLTFTPRKEGRFEIGCRLARGEGSHYTAGTRGQRIVN